MKNKKILQDPISELNDSIKRLLVLELFKLNVPQLEIAKKLHIDINFVNNFLKGAKRKEVK